MTAALAKICTHTPLVITEAAALLVFDAVLGSRAARAGVLNRVIKAGRAPLVVPPTTFALQDVFGRKRTPALAARQVSDGGQVLLRLKLRIQLDAVDFGLDHLGSRFPFPELVLGLGDVLLGQEARVRLQLSNLGGPLFKLPLSGHDFPLH